MIQVWRITKRKFAKTAFSGDGARLFGGRWNLPGKPLVYTAATLSLAALELCVNLDPAELPAHFVSIAAFIPDSVSRTVVTVADLPPHWRRNPAPLQAQMFGDAWLERGKTALLVIPSAVIPEENNFILNPTHKDFRAVRIGAPRPFAFDPRLRN